MVTDMTALSPRRMDLGSSSSLDSRAIIPYFQRLGERIEREWIERSYEEEIFPQMVLDALELEPPSEHVDALDIVDWTFGPSHAFRQPTNRELFGEPPVLLFQAPRFFIEALFWFSGTTEIHEHSFSGAFAVLAGSSVHSHWHFSPERTINSRMVSGRLERVSTEILRPGGVRPIRSGDRLIHQLFHLEIPSVTIVVRTNGDRNHLPQYKYLRPGLAIDPEHPDGLRSRRLIFLNSMARGQLNGLREYATRLIEHCDLETLFYTFSGLTRGKKVDKGTLDELYGIARQRHGAIVDLFHQVCEGERRTRIVTILRSKVSDSEARFLLALLMLMPDRDAILETIRLEFPDSEPMAMVETWLERISGKETMGFDFHNTNRLIFRSLVEGLDADSLWQRLQTELGSDSLDGHRDRLLDHAKQMAGSDLFRPLFSRSPLQEEV